MANPTTVKWFLILLGACVASPYVLRVSQRSRRQWFYVTLTVAFMFWVLFFMGSLRSR